MRANLSKPDLYPFPSTHWTTVARAGSGPARHVLGKLLERYLPPMRSYLLAQFGVQPDEADDLLQAFLADKILEEGIIAKADQSRGRFRSFLIRALDHFAVGQFRGRSALKRLPPGGLVLLPEPALNQVPAPATADAFDVAWARQVVELALLRTKQECQAGDRADLWEVFETRVLRPTLGQAPAVPLDELASRLGLTAAQTSNLAITAKRTFARALRSVVGEYAVDAQDVEDELRRLSVILSTAGAGFVDTLRM